MERQLTHMSCLLGDVLGFSCVVHDTLELKKTLVELSTLLWDRLWQ